MSLACQFPRRQIGTWARAGVGPEMGVTTATRLARIETIARTNRYMWPPWIHPRCGGCNGTLTGPPRGRPRSIARRGTRYISPAAIVRGDGGICLARRLPRAVHHWRCVVSAVSRQYSCPGAAQLIDEPERHENDVEAPIHGVPVAQPEAWCGVRILTTRGTGEPHRPCLWSGWRRTDPATQATREREVGSDGADG